MNKRLTQTLLAALLAVGMPWSAPALRGEGFRVSTLDAGAPVTGISLADVGGDRRADLVVTVAEKTPTGTRRVVLTYVQDRGAFPARPSRRVVLGDDVTAILTADIEGNAARELLALDDRGLAILRGGEEHQAHKEPERLLKLANRFYRPAADSVKHVHRTVDLNGDGRDDLVLPSTGGYRVLWGRKGGGLEPGPLFKATQKTEYGWGWGNTWFVMTDSLPACVTADTNGDRRADIVLRDKETLTIFEQKRDGTFPDKGRAVEIDTPDGGGGEGPAPDTVHSTTLLRADVDGNGRMDLLSVGTEGQLSLFSSFAITVRLHKNDRRKGLSTEPDQAIRLQGTTLGAHLADLSGDGRPDLVVPVIDTALFSNLVDRLKGRMKVTYNVFFFEKTFFSRNPTFTHTTWIPYDVVEGKTGIPQAEFPGDFNGDGRIDMLYADRPDRLGMFVVERDDPWFGGPTYSIDDTPMAVLEIENPGPTLARDLNGDDRADLVVRYRPGAENSDRIVIMMSR